MTGTLRCRRGSGRLSQFIADRIGLPEDGELLPARLEVIAGEGKERWIRQIGRRRLASLQMARSGLLVERVGPAALGFAMDVREGVLYFESVRQWLFGIPLPWFLAPRVAASAEGLGETWRMSVCVEAPLIGLVAEYSGVMKPAPADGPAG